MHALVSSHVPVQAHVSPFMSAVDIQRHALQDPICRIELGGNILPTLTCQQPPNSSVVPQFLLTTVYCINMFHVRYAGFCHGKNMLLLVLNGYSDTSFVKQKSCKRHNGNYILTLDYIT